MTNSTMAPVAGSQFTPRSLVAVCIGSYTVNLYLVVDETMEVHERAHVFHVNKAALASQTIPTRLQFDALGNQLNLAATMDGAIHDWIRDYQDSWNDFESLKVLSFHNVKGDIITNTTAIADATILLPVQDGNIADCRNQHVKIFPSETLSQLLHSP